MSDDDLPKQPSPYSALARFALTAPLIIITGFATYLFQDGVELLNAHRTNDGLYRLAWTLVILASVIGVVLVMSSPAEFLTYAAQLRQQRADVLKKYEALLKDTAEFRTERDRAFAEAKAVAALRVAARQVGAATDGKPAQPKG